MAIRGVRGATTVKANVAEEILSATQVLLEEMIRVNGILIEDLAAVFFTLTSDLNAAFPAQAARQMGWQYVPLLDAQEIPVPGSLPRCIRVLMLWNTAVPQRDIVHVYQGEARSLRLDLVGLKAEPGEEESL
jgi:chorismate mutase